MKETLLRSETRRVEVLSSCCAIGWAILLFGPWNLLHPPQYQALRQIVPAGISPEVWWGAIQAALGLLGMLSLVRGWQSGRMAALFLQGGVWAAVFASFVEYQQVLTGMVTYSVLAGSCMVAFATLWRGRN